MVQQTHVYVQWCFVCIILTVMISRSPTSDLAKQQTQPAKADDKDAADKSATLCRSDDDLLIEPSDEAVVGSSDDESGAGDQDDVAEEVRETKLEEEVAPKEVPREPSPPPLDYDEQLEKYGWKFQIPGDPLGLK